MAKGVAYRPKLLPPRGRLLERNYKPWRTCILVSLVLTLLIGMIFGLTAYNIYIHRFGENNHFYHGGDEISLLKSGKDLSSIFCSSYKVWPYGQADIYLLPNVAKLDPNSRISKTFNVTARHENYETHVRYLNEESNVDLTACRHVPPKWGEDHDHGDEGYAEFLVIVGDDHFDQWTKYFNPRHTSHKVPIPQNATCEGNVTLPHLAFQVSQADNYYFVVVTRRHIPNYPISSDFGKESIVLMGKLNETTLDISQALANCSRREPVCRFPVTWNEQHDVVAKIFSSNSSDNPQSIFTTDCIERLPFWIAIFGCLPLVLMVMGSLLCWYNLVKTRKIQDHYRQYSDEAPPTPRNYGSTERADSPLLQEHSNSQEDELCGASIQDCPIED